MSRRHTPRAVQAEQAITESLTTSNPDAPSTEDLRISIEASLRAILKAWPLLLDPIKLPGVAMTGKPGSRPPTSLAHLSLVAEITTDLAFWCHALLDDHPEGLPDGEKLDLSDARQMIAHLLGEARWASGWTFGNRMACELEDHAKEARALAWPKQHSMPLGPCPIPDEGTGDPCGGIVRVEDNTDLETGGATCRACRTYATIDWWYSHIVGNPEAKTLVTVQEITVIAAYEMGATIARSTVRKWVERGHLEPVDKDTKGRTLFDRRDAMHAVRRQLKVAVNG